MEVEKKDGKFQEVKKPRASERFLNSQRGRHVGKAPQTTGILQRPKEENPDDLWEPITRHPCGEPPVLGKGKRK